MAEAGWRAWARNNRPGVCSLDELLEVGGDLHGPGFDLDDGLGDQLARALYWAVRDELEANGMGAVRASTVALRSVRQAVLRMLRFEQQEVLDLLGVKKRTASYDAKRVRGALEDGRAHDAAARRLPPVPLPDGDRVVVGSHPERRR